MSLRNFTPHQVNLVLENGTVSFESEGVARVALTKESRGAFTLLNGVEVPLFVSDTGDVTGLPEAQPGVFLLVSGMVRSALPDRRDLLSPGDLVRDDKGRVQGCTSLFCND